MLDRQIYYGVGRSVCILGGSCASATERKCAERIVVVVGSDVRSCSSWRQSRQSRGWLNLRVPAREQLRRHFFAQPGPPRARPARPGVRPLQPGPRRTGQPDPN